MPFHYTQEKPLQWIGKVAGAMAHDLSDLVLAINLNIELVSWTPATVFR